MIAVIKISNHTDFTLNRESGNTLYNELKNFLNTRIDIKNIIFDFKNVPDVSTSFIQATVLKMINNGYNVELINYNESVRFKIATLVKIADIDPRIFKKAASYPRSPVYV